jgi:DNA-binding NarL/FixJ family response regulator
MSTPILPTIRVLVVDDHTVMRAGLCMLLESQPGLSVVGEASTCADAVTAASREQPDVIVLDLLLGSENALDCLARLRAAASGARVLILTGVYDPQMHRKAVLLGAVGLVLKENAPETLPRPSSACMPVRSGSSVP